MIRLLLVCLLAASACREATRNLASDPAPAKNDAGRPDATTVRSSDASQDAAVDAGPRVPERCGDHVCACDDGRDNDGDGLIDGLDPECTGPFDDDESSFATGAPTSQARCQDCFWDNNAGSGDDDCRYPIECASGGSPATHGASCSSCDVSQRCVDSCQKRTPNGCDCFGCCEVHKSDGSRVLIQLSDSCSLAKLDDVVACPRCTVQSSSCRNDCGTCELCPGRNASTLPAECSASAPKGGVAYTCNPGQQVCSETEPCPTGTYCQLGCCLYAVQ